MIVDTSALVAVLTEEQGADGLLATLVDVSGLLPTPAYVEYLRVASRRDRSLLERAELLVTNLLSRNLRLLPFSVEHARAAINANYHYGIGNGRGGTLNLLDIMVYGCAVTERRPILCTGRDFAATDAVIHPASRSW